MSYKLVHKDVLSIKADAIINAANTKPICTPGTEMDLYQLAGAEQMLEARRSIGEIPYGEAKCTQAFCLKAKYVIHKHGHDRIRADIADKEVLYEFSCTCIRTGL